MTNWHSGAPMGDNGCYDNLVNTKELMDYETYIDIKQYSPDSVVYYTLKVTDVMNNDYYYDGCSSTLDDAMNSIKFYLKQHQN